jgi:hypothetical protein
VVTGQAHLQKIGERGVLPRGMHPFAAGGPLANKSPLFQTASEGDARGAGQGRWFSRNFATFQHWQGHLRCGNVAD